jgi:hypothetical protein
VSFFDHILDTLRANGLDATDLDTVKGYAEHDRARLQQMTSAERASLRAREVREAYHRLHRAAEATALILKDEGLVAGELWDETGTDFIFCFASGMQKLDDLGQDWGDPGDFPRPPSDN